jgi:hypothetical protein
MAALLMTIPIGSNVCLIGHMPTLLPEVQPHFAFVRYFPGARVDVPSEFEKRCDGPIFGQYAFYRVVIFAPLLAITGELTNVNITMRYALIVVSTVIEFIGVYVAISFVERHLRRPHDRVTSKTMPW